jgi:hypothetical protein
MKGLQVLQLWGNRKERGFAHGYLLADQIIDFFQYYVLESRLKSAKVYLNTYAPFYEKNFTYAAGNCNFCV